MSGYSAPTEPSSSRLPGVLDPRNLAASLSQNLAPAPPDPSEVLLNLCLPEPLVKALDAPLRTLGFAITQQSERLKYGGAQRRLTMVANDGVQRILIHVPKEILGNPIQRNLSPVMSLGFTFPPGTVLFVFSEGLPYIPFAYENLFRGWKQERQIEATFVPWPQVGEFQQIQEAEGQVLFVKDRLRLSGFVWVLAQAELDRIKSIVAEQAAAAPEGSKEFIKTLVREATLSPEFKQQVADIWTGDALGDAQKLVEWAVAKGRNPADQLHTTLAALLLKLRDKVGTDRDWVVQIIDRQTFGE